MQPQESTYILLVTVDGKRVGWVRLSMRGEETTRRKETVIAFQEVSREVLRTDFGQDRGGV